MKWTNEMKKGFPEVPSFPAAHEPLRLAGMIAKWTEGKHRTETAIPGLVLHRWSSPTEPSSYMFAPHLCLIAQGVKRILLGDEAYVYDAQTFVVSSVELPIVSHVLEATPEKPYLGLTLELDLKEISRLMLHGSLPPASSSPTDRGIGVSKLTPPLLNAVERLLALLDTPEEIPVFQRLVEQEIYYRLLMDEGQGTRLRQIIMAESRSNQIARAIDWMKRHFDQPLHISELAKHAGMSPSGFHQHFRALTAISPLQFQKRIRLNEARRLMLLETWTRGMPPSGWAMKAPPSSTGSTSACSEIRPARILKCCNPRKSDGNQGRPAQRQPPDKKEAALPRLNYPGEAAPMITGSTENRYSVMPAASASAALASRRAARMDIFTRPLSSIPMHLAVTTSPTLTTSSVFTVRPSASSEM